jgi:hypothetical protein
MFDESVASKFILSPSGLGWDCYRNYESYMLGAIPVMESLPGLDRTFAVRVAPRTLLLSDALAPQ